MKDKGKWIRRSVSFLIVVASFASIFLISLAKDETLFQYPTLYSISNWASNIEDQFYDIRLRKYRDKKSKNDSITLLHVNDETLEKMGRWPLTRTVWKDVLGKLSTLGAKVVSFDIFFSEPERSCSEVSPDMVLRDAIAEFQSDPTRKVVLPYSLAAYGDPVMEEVPGELYDFIVDSQVRGIGEDLSLGGEEGTAPASLDAAMEDDSMTNDLLPEQINRTTFPVTDLLEATPSLGYLNAEADLDGVFRRFRLVANIDSLYFPSLALMTYSAYTGDNPKVVIGAAGDVYFKTAKGELELNRRGEAKVRFFGDRGQFREIAVHDFLDKDVNDPSLLEMIKDKIVFVASTAIGAHDIRHSPINPMMAGVFMHMNLTHMLLDSFFLKEKFESIKISLFILILGVFLILFTQRFDNAVFDLFFTVGLGTGIYFLDVLYFLPQGYEIKLAYILGSFLALYGWTTFFNFYRASREKKQIKGAFSQMIAPAIVDEMLKHPEKLQLGGEKKDITCLFSDVRDFTSISEKLTPEQLSYALNKYMTVMTNILFDTKGTLDKYIGDAIVGYWGAPMADSYHAYHAVYGAKKMVEALPEINEQFEKEKLPLFKFGIGLNSGVCSVGNMGSDKIFSYTALGDNMNLGARLEGLCKFYGVQLMISEFTYNKMTEEQRKEFVFRKLDMVQVKGKENAVTIYEVFHDFHHLINDQKAQDDFAHAFELYTQQKFEEALTILTPYLEKYPEDKSFKRLSDSCLKYIQDPPPADWNGVTKYETK